MIRRMAGADLDDIAKIWLESNLEAHGFVPADYWRGKFDEVREQIAHAEVYVYEDGGGVEGFIGLDGSYVEGLFVRQGSRSKGIGARLLGLAKAMREELALDVYVQNFRAREFYEREGFRVLSEGTDVQTGQAEVRMVWEAGT